MLAAPNKQFLKDVSSETLVFEILNMLILYYFGVDFWSIFGPKIDHKSIKNRYKKSFKFHELFWSIFDRFWEGLGSQVGLCWGILAPSWGLSWGMLGHLEASCWEDVDKMSNIDQDEPT